MARKFITDHSKTHPIGEDFHPQSEGPPGPQGIQGPQGPVGPQGPPGADGAGGGGGATLSDNTPANLGAAASAGTGTLASRDDHVHLRELPAQASHANEMLVTDGNNPAWAVQPSPAGFISLAAITAEDPGTATGSGNFTTGVKFRVIRADFVTGVEHFWTGAATTIRLSLWTAGGVRAAFVDHAVSGPGLFTALFSSPYSIPPWTDFWVTAHDLAGLTYTSDAVTGLEQMPFISGNVIYQVSGFASVDSCPDGTSTNLYGVTPVLQVASGGGVGGGGVALGNTAGVALGTASAGSSLFAARMDHVHPTEIPAQTGQGGKVLGTDGSNPLWVAQSGGGVTDGVPVLYFNGIAQHVTHGGYWKQGQTMANAFRWEVWAQGDPWTSGAYIVADGYGGGHSLLWGPQNGNIIFNQGIAGEEIVSFGADDAPPAGIFSCLDIRIQSDPYGLPILVMRTNGIPVGIQYIPAGKTRTGAGAGSGPLFIAGSDHSNFKGWIACIRAWDNAAASDNYPRQAYVPPRFFGSEGPNGEDCTFLVSYQYDRLQQFYPDYSSGYDGQGAYTKRVHPGRPYRGLDYTPFYGMPPTPAANLPAVNYVLNAPFDATYDQTNATLLTSLGRGYTPKTVPVGAKIFDSFSRHDQEFAHLDVPDFGSIEYSSFGAVQRWKSDYSSGNVNSVPTPYNPSAGVTVGGEVQKAAVGIFNRSAVPLDLWPTIAWVNNNSADMTVKVNRRGTLATSSDGCVAVAFRVVDEGHFWSFMYSHIKNGQGTIVDDSFYLFRWDGVDSVGVLVASAAVPGGSENFTTLSVTTSGNSIVCNADGVTVISLTNATYNTAVGCGLWWPVQGALSRRYDFTVL